MIALLSLPPVSLFHGHVSSHPPRPVPNEVIALHRTTSLPKDFDWRNVRHCQSK